MRLYNPNIDKEISDKIDIELNNSGLFETNLNEEKLLNINENEKIFKSCEVKTIGFNLVK